MDPKKVLPFRISHLGLFSILLLSYSIPGYPIDKTRDNLNFFSKDTLNCKKENRLSPLLQSRLRISGNFGEYRKDHFHQGLDFRVDGKIGLPVLSPKPGRLYKLAFEKKGYGLSLSIRHNDDTYSFFAHLDQIANIFWNISEIKELKKKFEKREEFSVTLKEDGPGIKTGDIVAFTGETGTGPPHLHFEYLDNEGWPLNPLIGCGLSIRDQNPPVFTRLFVIPVDEQSGLKDKKRMLELTPRRIRRNHFILRKAVKAFGRIKLKVAGFDNTNTDNVLSFYALSLLVNKKEYYNLKFRKFHPDRKHRMGLVYDVEDSSYSGITYVYRLYSEAPEALGNQKGSGFISLEPGSKKKYHIKIVARDAGNNISKLTFVIESIGAKQAVPRQKIHEINYNLFPDRGKIFFSGNKKASIRFPPKSVLTPSKITLSTNFIKPELPKGIEPIFPVYEIKPRDQYIEKPFKFTIPIDLSAGDTKNSGIFHIQERTNKVFLLKRIKKHDEKISIESRQMGLIALLRDNSPPEWLGSHFDPNIYYRPDEFVPGVYVKDIGLGIDPDSITAYLDNKKWSSHYNPNRSWIYLDLNPFNLSSGKHKISLKVKDYGGNESPLYMSYFRIRRKKYKEQAKKEFIVERDKNTTILPVDLALSQENSFASVDKKFTIIFPANSLKSARKIYIKRYKPAKIKDSLRWNMRGNYLYYVHIPSHNLRSNFQISYEYPNASGDQKSSIVKVIKSKLFHIKNNYHLGSRSFYAENIKKGGLFGIYYDDSPPQWGDASFREKKIYEKYNIPLSVYIFDDGLGIDTNSIEAKIDDKTVPVSYSRKRNRIKILFSRKKIKKGFHRLRIKVKDYAGNPASSFSKYFIIRYKPKWRWN